jgi:hypothetical protein
MQCSDTIGAIAAALARAQGELTNPENPSRPPFRSLARASGPSAMPRWPVVWTLSARVSASTRS